MEKHKITRILEIKLGIKNLILKRFKVEGECVNSETDYQPFKDRAIILSTSLKDC